MLAYYVGCTCKTDHKSCDSFDGYDGLHDNLLFLFCEQVSKFLRKCTKGRVFQEFGDKVGQHVAHIWSQGATP